MMEVPEKEASRFAYLLNASEEDFEDAVEKLDIRGFISLVSCLQNAMAQEQQRFDQLTRYLDKCNNPSSSDYQLTSAALCASQAKLAQLCGRNMKCFTQQARRAQQDHVTVVGSRNTDGNSSSSAAASNDSEAVRIRKNGFRDSLMFFELQAKMNSKNGRGPPGGSNSSNGNSSSSSGSSTLPTEFSIGSATVSRRSTLQRNGLSASSPSLLDVVDPDAAAASLSPGRDSNGCLATTHPDFSGGGPAGGVWKGGGSSGFNSASPNYRSLNGFCTLPRSNQRGSSDRLSSASDDWCDDNARYYDGGSSSFSTAGFRRLCRAGSLGDGLDSSGVAGAGGGLLRKAPSVEEILQTVKDLRMRQQTSSVAPELPSRNQNGNGSNNNNNSVPDLPGSPPWSQQRNREAGLEPVTALIVSSSSTSFSSSNSNPSSQASLSLKSLERRIYANVPAVTSSSPESEPYYENVCGGDEDDIIDEPIYERIGGEAEPLYDVPRQWPGGPRPVAGVGAGGGGPSIVPTATQLVLQASHMASPSPKLTPKSVVVVGGGGQTSLSQDSDTLSDCDKDSLEENGDPPELEDEEELPEEEEVRQEFSVGQARLRAPDIPSPDYGSDEEDDAAYGVYDDYSSCSEYTSDSGLGESDGRSTYYPDDQGLEVIVEEEEEDLEEEEEEEEEEEDEDYGSRSDKVSSLEYYAVNTHVNAQNLYSNGFSHEEDNSDDSIPRQGRSSGDLSPDGSNPRRGSAISCPDKFDLPDSAVDVDDLSSSDGGVTSPDPTAISDSSQLFSPSTEYSGSPRIFVTSPEPVDEVDLSQRAASPPPKPPRNSITELKGVIVDASKVNQTNGDDRNEDEKILRTTVNGQVQNGHHKKHDSLNGSHEESVKMMNKTNSLANDTKSLGGEEDDMDVRHLLPSVKALRSQFESKNENGVSSSHTLPKSNGVVSGKRRPQSGPSRSDSWAGQIPRNGNHSGPCEGNHTSESVSTVELKQRSHSVVSQSDKSIPELLKSLAKPKDLLNKQKSSSKSKKFEITRCGMNGTVRTAKPIFSPDPPVSPEDVIPSIIAQFGSSVHVDENSQKRSSTYHWDPTLLLNELYEIQSPQPTYSSDAETSFINIEGYLDKLPSGRKKATFWNAWKRRFFRLKDGYLYYYQNHNAEKPSLTLNLMGGHIDSMETTMLGMDDGKTVTGHLLGIDSAKGHYVVVRCNTKQETDQWKAALQTHTAENFNLTYTQPVPAYPHFYEDVIILDLGSCSVRAGILCNQPTLPQLFFPTVCNTQRETGNRIYGIEALSPDNRSNTSISFPLRPSTKLTKFSVDLDAVAGILTKVFKDLNVDPRKYQIQLSLPRSFTVRTQTEVLRILFSQFEVRSVNLTTQTVLSLLSYNATSGIIVDIGERMDVIPIIDGYVVEPGVSRIPYGGARIMDHIRHFLLQRHYSLVSDMESYLVRYVMEQACYCAEKYNEELQSYFSDPESYEQTIPIQQFFQNEAPWDEISVDNGRFQAPEGLFNPDAWGLDNPGIHKLVHKAIQECSLDIRKEMTRSIYLSGGVTLLPGFANRLELEVDKLTPPSLIPKVHSSPYRYHAAYLGACVLAGSPGFQEAKITREDWEQSGTACLRKWHL